MLTNKSIEVLKEGVTPHECGSDWAMEFASESPKGTIVYSQICKICGRVEKVTEYHKTETFNEVYQKFHGGDINACI